MYWGVNGIYVRDGESTTCNATVASCFNTISKYLALANHKEVDSTSLPHRPMSLRVKLKRLNGKSLQTTKHKPLSVVAVGEPRQETIGELLLQNTMKTSSDISCVPEWLSFDDRLDGKPPKNAEAILRCFVLCSPTQTHSRK
jgi:hypothetical protein